MSSLNFLKLCFDEFLQYQGFLLGSITILLGFLTYERAKKTVLRTETVKIQTKLVREVCEKLTKRTRSSRTNYLLVDYLGIIRFNIGHFLSNFGLLQVNPYLSWGNKALFLKIDHESNKPVKGDYEFIGDEIKLDKIYTSNDYVDFMHLLDVFIKDPFFPEKLGNLLKNLKKNVDEKIRNNLVPVLEEAMSDIKLKSGSFTTPIWDNTNEMDVDVIMNIYKKFLDKTVVDYAVHGKWLSEFLREAKNFFDLR